MRAPAVVVVGAGHGGLQAAASLRQQGFAGPITLIAEEPGHPYQRPPLSKAYLTGGADDAALLLRGPAFYADHQVDLRAGERALAIDRAGRTVELAHGAVAYDHLILATGARNRALALPGAELAGVHALRGLADAVRLRDALAGARRAVAVGGGFIGLEVAASAVALGVRVTVVEAADRLMARVVSAPMAQRFQRAHEQAGVDVRLATTVARIDGADGRVRGVVTDRGERLDADLVLVAVGVTPDVELAAAAGLAVDDGIVVDEQLRTSDPHVSAIGDCARCAGLRLESVQNASDQARCVATRLATGQGAAYAAVPWFWSDQGPLKLQIAGVTAGHDETVVVAGEDGEPAAVYCFGDGRLLGLESVNRPGEHLAARRALAPGVARPSPRDVGAAGFDLRAYARAALS